MDEDREPFLKRWSRRKRQDTSQTAERNPAAVDDAADKAKAPASQEFAIRSTSGQNEALQRSAPAGSSQDETEPLDLASLPKPDELKPDSDIRAFLDRRVPEATRNAALKRIWTLDPTIRDFIEVAENQWDWNTPGGAPGYEPIEDAQTVARLLDHAVGVITNYKRDETVILSSETSFPGALLSPDAAAQTIAPITIRSERPQGIAATGTHASAEDEVATQNKSENANSMPAFSGRRHGRALPE